MYSVVSLFCDDIREEKSGVDTLVGVLPDNVNVPSLPFVFPKMGIYLRINIPVTGDGPKSIAFWITAPDPMEFPTTTIEPHIVEQARRQARETGGAIGGLITKAVITLLQVKTAGRITMHVKIDDQVFVGGSLNVQMVGA